METVRTRLLDGLVRLLTEYALTPQQRQIAQGL